MCNEYAREIEMGHIIRLMEEMKDVPPLPPTDIRAVGLI